MMKIMMMMMKMREREVTIGAADRVKYKTFISRMLKKVL